MKFVFDYEETLSRRITLEAKTLQEAISEIERRIDDEEIVLNSEDFFGGQISMPLDENYLPALQYCGENMENTTDLNLVIDFW